MEGITDEYYRDLIYKLYPEWDYMTCDFLRISTVGDYPDKHVIKHYGKDIYAHEGMKNKNIYQILTCEKANTEFAVSQIDRLGFDWLDINLGCPSKTVCKNGGGSYLLSDLPALKKIITTIRTNFKKTFTAKIRVGYRDDHSFIDILKLLEDCGVDAITIHARTRDELYRGVANWDYVKEAVKAVNIPIVGNGDIWTVEDINRYYDYTNAHSVMIARGALKTPWLAHDYKNNITDTSEEYRRIHMKKYYLSFLEILHTQKLNEAGRVKRLKSVSRNIFDHLEDPATFRRSFLLSKSEEAITEVINGL